MKQKQDAIFKETMRNKRKDHFCMNRNFLSKQKNQGHRVETAEKLDKQNRNGKQNRREKKPNFRVNPECQRSKLLFKKGKTKRKNINELIKENVAQLKMYTDENLQNEQISQSTETWILLVRNHRCLLNRQS